MCIILQNCFIREGNIRAKEYAKCVFLAKSAHRIREKNHRIVNFVQGTLIAMDHVGAAFHRYRVKTAGIKGSSKVRKKQRDRGKFCVNESNFGTSEQIYTKIPVVSAKCGKEDESGETGAGTKSLFKIF